MVMDEPMEIPKFDLAEEIMAEQRKAAATRRKGPGRKADAVKRETHEPASAAVLPAPAMLSLQAEQVIAEIVARDIRQLCGGNAE